MCVLHLCLGVLAIFANVCATETRYLLQNRPDDFEWQWTELVLLEEVIKVLLKHLEHQAGVTAVLKALQGAHHVVLISILAAQPSQDLHLGINKEENNASY